MSTFFTNEDIKKFIKIKIIKSPAPQFSAEIMSAAKNSNLFTLLMNGGNVFDGATVKNVFGAAVETLSLKDFPGEDVNYVNFQNETNLICFKYENGAAYLLGFTVIVLLFHSFHF